MKNAELNGLPRATGKGDRVWKPGAAPREQRPAYGCTHEVGAQISRTKPGGTAGFDLSQQVNLHGAGFFIGETAGRAEMKLTKRWRGRAQKEHTDE